MTYPQIPAEIGQELDSLRVASASAFQRQDWETAARRFGETYDFLLVQQRHYGQRFHKGWELYNRGVTLVRAGQIDDGLRSILLAYAEDVLSADPIGVEDANLAPARMSWRGIKDAEGYLNPIKEAAIERKQEGGPCLDPQEIYNRAQPRFPQPLEVVGHELRAMRVDSRGIDTFAGYGEKRSVDTFPGPFEKRCFIGCNYYTGGPYFEELRRVIAEDGFDPIVALEFDVSEDDIHHHSLLLLHLCKKAVFEVTYPAGQLMELERCRDYGITPLIVRHVMPDAEPNVAEVSAMISTMANQEVSTYSNTGQLRDLVRAYLHA